MTHTDHTDRTAVKQVSFSGAGALHLAIAYNNNELVQDLVEAGANVNQRAIGKFFINILIFFTRQPNEFFLSMTHIVFKIILKKFFNMYCNLWPRYRPKYICTIDAYREWMNGSRFC